MIKHQLQQRRDTFIATNPRNYAEDQKNRFMEVYANDRTVLVLLRYKTGMVWCEKWLEREGISVRIGFSPEKIPLDFNNYPPKAEICGIFQPSATMPSEIEYEKENPTLIMIANFYGLKQKIINMISETGVVTKGDLGDFCVDFPT